MTPSALCGQARGAVGARGRRGASQAGGHPAEASGKRGKPLVWAAAVAGRTCALDLGRARIGVAVDDELGLLAHPRGTLDPRDRKALLDALRRFADDENIARFVVGLPIHMSGREGREAREARALSQAIADATGRPVELWDERLTTVQAQRALRDSRLKGGRVRARVDEAAACAILQAWLDSRQAPHD